MISDFDTSFYMFTDRSFDELLFLFHKSGYDPAPSFVYSDVKQYMLSRRWLSLADACNFLKRYLVKVIK